MNLTEEQLKQIIKEEFNNLINEEEIDEKLFSALKNFGKGLLNKFTKPNPEASAGVGRAFARYKVPQKKPSQPEDPEQEKQPSTAIVRAPSTAVGEPNIPQSDVERGAAAATVEPRTALPAPDKEPQEPATIVGELPPASKIPLQLPAPKKIGVVSDYGSLMSSADDKNYKYLYDSCINEFPNTQYYSQLNSEQQKSASDNINTVLKHLVATKRVIQNPTIGPLKEDNTRPTPSLQQIGQTDFNSWYVASLVNTTIKHFGNSIRDEIVKFVIGFLFNQGRLAISQRLYNKLIHTNDPRITNNLSTEEPEPQQESKSYSSFYNNWKKYIGVKI
jgi:hypothetical protein